MKNNDDKQTIIFANGCVLSGQKFIAAINLYLDRNLLEPGLIDVGRPAGGEVFLRWFRDRPGNAVLVAGCRKNLAVGTAYAEKAFAAISRELAGFYKNSGEKVARLIVFCQQTDDIMVRRFDSLVAATEIYRLESLQPGDTLIVQCRRVRARPIGIIRGQPRLSEGLGHMFESQPGHDIARSLGCLLPDCLPNISRGSLRMLNPEGLAVIKLVPLARGCYRAVVGPQDGRGAYLYREIRSAQDLDSIAPAIIARRDYLYRQSAPEARLAAMLSTGGLADLSRAAGLDLSIIENPPTTKRGPVDFLAIERANSKLVIIELKSRPDARALPQAADYYYSLADTHGFKRLGPVILVAPSFPSNLAERARLYPFACRLITYDADKLAELPLGSDAKNIFRRFARSAPLGINEQTAAAQIRSRCIGPLRGVLDDLECACRDIGLVRFVPSKKIIAYRLHPDRQPAIPVFHLDPQERQIQFSLRLDRLHRAGLNEQRLAAAFERTFANVRRSRCFVRTSIVTGADAALAAGFCRIISEELKLFSGGCGPRQLEYSC